MKKNYLRISIFALFVSLSFIGNLSAVDFDVNPQGNQQVNNDRLKEIIGKINSGEITSLDGERLITGKALANFYSGNDYQLFWNNPQKANEAIVQIESAWKDGLNADDYHLKKIKALQERLKNNPTDQTLSIDFDVLLSDGLLLFAYHLIKGKLQPENLDPIWNFQSRELPENAMDRLIVAINSNQLSEFLMTLLPQSHFYRELRNATLKYTDIVNKGGWEALVYTKTIHPGESTELATQLRNRLIAEGYDLEMNTDATYDPELVEQVKLFQKSSGLNPDGVIGKNTVIALNETATSKLNKLKINMERSRWIMVKENSEFIVVNIANFQLYFVDFDTHTVTYTSKVMVGKDNKQTPVFRDELQTIVLNPTWTLPYSIASTETLSKLKKDPEYLRKHNMVLLDSKGKIVSDSGIDWQKYKQGTFPYTVRQEPGPHNALGRVKFLFPNKYAIYLHDTPAKFLFSKEKRAFSHGCIRLQDPLDFALFLLQKEDPSWSEDKIQKILDAKDTKNINLDKKIPIYMIYWTAGIDEDQQLYFVPDIYNRDKKVLEGLNKAIL